MAATRCISSQLMSPLIAWRNPQGKEETWMGQHQGVNSVFSHVVTVIIAEVGFIALTATSVAETMIYTALKIASLAIYRFSDRPYKFCSALLQSSSFTILWSFSDALIYNVFVVNLMTRESFARFWAERTPLPVNFFRFEDRVVISDWAQQHRPQNANNAMLGPIITNSKETQKLIDEGAKFIHDEIFSAMNKKEKELYGEVDSGIMMFVLTKAIFIYSFGKKCNESIPGFFKKETQTAIQELRNLQDKSNYENISTKLGNFEDFEKDSEESLKAEFNKIRNIAYGETKQGLFLIKCWSKVDELAKKND